MLQYIVNMWKKHMVHHGATMCWYNSILCNEMWTYRFFFFFLSRCWICWMDNACRSLESSRQLPWRSGSHKEGWLAWQNCVRQDGVEEKGLDIDWCLHSVFIYFFKAQTLLFSNSMLERKLLGIWLRGVDCFGKRMECESLHQASLRSWKSPENCQERYVPKRVHFRKSSTTKMSHLSWI